MKALILAGGYGTRLRPFTLNTPKPLMDFVNKPIIVHQLDALKEVGVKEVVIAVNYKKDDLCRSLSMWSERSGVKLIFSEEDTPLGTGGPIALASSHLADSSFFVLNSDVICDFPLKQLLEFHRKMGAEGTILTTKVSDPSKYGVVVSDEGRITRFVEKPKTPVGDDINAGIYLFESSVLKRIRPVPTSVEREIFPQMAREGRLFCKPISGFWMDIGNGRDFLLGTRMYLDHQQSTFGRIPAHSRSVVVGEHCEIDPYVVLGEGTRVGKCVRLSNCTVLPHTIIEDGCNVEDSIIGPRCRIEKWSSIRNHTFLGEDVKVSRGCLLNGVTVLPHKEVVNSIYEPKIVM